MLPRVTQRISLRKCGISDDTQLYYLAEVTDSSKGEERELRPSERPYGLPQASQRGPLRLHLRHKVGVAPTDPVLLARFQVTRCEHSEVFNYL